MAGVFDGSGFMDGDVAGLGCDDSLVVAEHGGDHGGVGLGAAGQQEDLGARAADGFADAGFR